MVGLKRFFHVDNLFQSPGVERNRNIVDGGPQAAENCDYGRPSSRQRSASDCSLGFSQQSYVNQKYLGIEKQFEEMHEQFCSRQLTPRDVKYTDLKPLPTRNSRHVDVLKAIFYSHREPRPSANSPTYYNEDIADRNLNAPQQQARQSQYACIVSAIYQEDVADRNILSGGSMLDPPGSGSSGPSSRFNSRTSGTGHSTPEGWGRRKRREKSPARYSSGRRAETNIVTMSEENLRTSAQKTQSHPKPQRSQPDNLRLRSSAPNLSKTVPKKTTSRPPQRPTIGNRSISSSSRKNILDLSIDTNLAAGKSSAKIDHCALQPPTTRPSRQKPSPSIAEIVNSPLQIPSASAASLSATNPSYSVDEIMAMLRQAYAASQAKNQNPTFENLQNAIIREITSPGALSEPSTASKIESPSIYSTPVSSAFKSETQTPFTESMRSSLLEEGRRLADYTKKGSPLGRRGSETSLRKIPSVLNGSENENGCTAPSRRRRHTYDQPQSGIVNTVQPFKKIHANSQKDHTENERKDRHNEIEAIPLPSASMPPTSPARSIFTPTADVDKITATIPMEPRSPKPTVNRTIGSISETEGKNQNFSRKTRYHTSPFPIGRRRIPLRRSSLFKDLYDSGRLAP